MNIRWKRVGDGYHVARTGHGRTVEEVASLLLHARGWSVRVNLYGARVEVGLRSNLVDAKHLAALRIALASEGMKS